MYPYITYTIGTEWIGYPTEKEKEKANEKWKKEEAKEEKEEEVEATLQDGYEVEATQRVASSFDSRLLF